MSAQRLVALAVLASVLGACTATATSNDQPAGPHPDSRSPLVSSEVPYAAALPGWADADFDLYLPADPGELPLVVIVPDTAADTTRGADYVELARDLAAAGVVAALIDWGVSSPELSAVSGRAVGELVAQAEQEAAEVSCALVVAATKSGLGQGSSARPLVVVGHGTGANAAAMAALTNTRAFDSCFATGPSARVSAALLWDGDWLCAALGDDLGPLIAELLPAYSPWPEVDSLRTTTYVEVGVNANRLEGMAVPAGPTTGFLTTRDPVGTMTNDLSRVAAFDDGAVDPVDVTRAFALALQDAGIQSREREVHGEGDPNTLGPQVRALIVQSVVELSRS